MSRKVALIAGVGPDTGASVARASAGEGQTVARFLPEADSSKSVVEQIRAQGGTAVVMPTDVTNWQAANDTVAKISADLGPATILAYNASGYGRGSFLELDPC